jgi:prepilin-type N-terminal cleavage/methylation domain-containing protein
MVKQKRVLDLLKKIPKRAVTLMEIMTVLIIVGIVSAIGMLNYTNVKERAMGKEAQANLRLIAAAQRIYRMESGFYYPPGGGAPVISAINDNLRLTLANNGDWAYDFNVGLPLDQFTANATRGGTSTCVYHIKHNDPDMKELNHTGACP